MRKTTLLVMLFGLCLLLASGSAHATKQGSMKLLAVSEDGTTQKGMIADLTLELSPGTGRVFMDTYPLTKLDTQISTRFAREIACEVAKVDCNAYDFFYTIRANSPIIGGASAGTAIASLTAAMLLDLPVRQDVAVTGTINSGGIIGPVGGLPEKINAAAENGITIVIIPKGQLMYTDFEEENTTDQGKENTTYINLSTHAQAQNISVAQADHITVVLEIMTGKEFSIALGNGSILIDPIYSDVMKNLSIDLCDRTKVLSDGVGKTFHNETLSDIAKQASNLTGQAMRAKLEERYYSSASYCFGANTKYRYLFMLNQNISNVTLESVKQDLLQKITLFDAAIEEKELRTITDLETYMVVKERLSESVELLEQNSSDKVADVAFARERFYSAFAWSHFFDKGGKEFQLQKEDLKESCVAKTAEAQERIQYVNLYVPTLSRESSKELAFARAEFDRGNYELCLFRASKAKAQSDIIITMLSIRQEHLPQLFETKSGIINAYLEEQTKKGMFPILGYSYYEYAQSLKESDIGSALLYLEYAQELSNLGMYLKEEPVKKEIRYEFVTQERVLGTGIFILGLALGFALGRIRKGSPKRRRKI